MLLFDGRMIVTSNPKCSRKKFEDIVTWMKAFPINTMILTSYFPQRRKDLSQYKLLILRTYHQFGGRVWLNYDRAFRENAAAMRLTDWSTMNVQLYNFHAAGIAARGRSGDLATALEPTGDLSATTKCRSWNRSCCIALTGSCRFAHSRSTCAGDHRANVCPGLPSIVNSGAKRLAISSISPTKSRRSLRWHMSCSRI